MTNSKLLTAVVGGLAVSLQAFVLTPGVKEQWPVLTTALSAVAAALTAAGMFLGPLLGGAKKPKLRSNTPLPAAEGDKQ